jgi:RNA polymerase sigma factor (TIGR02999 family)
VNREGGDDQLSAADLGDMIAEAERLGGQCPRELFEALYRELHQIARRQLRGSGVTLGTTTLLHEAYLGLSSRATSFPDQARFLAYAGRAMRGLIVDHARANRALKRGGEFHFTELDTGAAERPAEDVSRIADALAGLEASDPKLAELVDLKYFCGFSVREIAAMRASSERTVERDWVKARLYLQRALER